MAASACEGVLGGKPKRIFPSQEGFPQALSFIRLRKRRQLTEVPCRAS